MPTAPGLRILAGLALTLAAQAPPRAWAAETMSLQEIVLRAKPATVLVVSEVATEVTLDCGAGPRKVAPSPFRETGTGWFIDSNGWVVTNAHVVQPAHQPPAWLINQQAQKAVVAACVHEPLGKQGFAPGQRPDLEEELRRTALARAYPTARVEAKPSIFILMANGFRLPAKVEKYSPPVSTQTGAGVMSGRDLALLAVEASEMPAFKLAESKNVKIGDPIHILGFPGVVLSHELLNATAKVEASVTNGAISSFKQDVQNQPVIQTDAPAAWGNSGGPAVNGQGDIVGVLTFVSLSPGAEGSIVQGFNFIIPADAVKEFLRGTKVDLADKSPFNEKWFSGLRKFFADDWKGALGDISAADRLQPEFPDLRRLMAEAEEKIKNPPPRPFPWRLLAGAVAVLIVGAAGAMDARRRRWNRRRLSPAALLRLSTATPPPLLLDVRDPVLYAASPYRVPGALRVDPEQIEVDLAALEIGRGLPLVTCCIADERNSARGATAARPRLPGRPHSRGRPQRVGAGGTAAGVEAARPLKRGSRCAAAPAACILSAMSPRPNLDFAAVDLRDGFTARAGGVAGITEKVLASDLDPAGRTGCRTRLLRLAPGTRTPEAHAHDYWEEIYLLEGDMTVAEPHGGERLVQAPSYACRKPGFTHGPVRTDRGCLLLEFSWY